MFRSGAAEGVFVLDKDGDQQILRGGEFEHQVGGFVKQYLMVTGNLEIEPPYYAFLSFVGIRECTFQLHPRIRLPDGGRMLHQENMILPEVVMEDRAVDPFRVLKPTFDMVWNAFGLIGSRNYDEQGNHVGNQGARRGRCSGQTLCPPMDGPRGGVCRARRAPRRRRRLDHNDADPPRRDGMDWKQRLSSARRAGREWGRARQQRAAR